jgi:hypothetical protein
VRTRFLSLILLASLTIGCGGGPTAKTQLQAPNSGQTASGGSSEGGSAASGPTHVFLIVEENRSFSTVYPTGMPWLSALGDEYGIATNYVSDQSGSLLDYLWLSSGGSELNFGCNGNGCSQPITDDNIFREITQAGLTWKVYADALPSTGFMGAQAGEYVARHNPAVWYEDVINSPAQQQNVVAFTQFATDLAAGNLPQYTIIIPDLLHDAHDGTAAMADQWLQQNIAPLLNSSYFQPGGNSVMFITFDNGDNDAQGQVFTAVVGQHVIPGIKVNAPFRHENTLRTIMEQLGLTNFPGASATAAPMNQFFH